VVDLERRHEDGVRHCGRCGRGRLRAGTGGPSVMALAGTQKTMEQLQMDDRECQ
jgi:hypothetical protein